MIRLSREFRFSLVASETAIERSNNSWSGWFGSNRIAPFLKFQLTVSGDVDLKTGYLINIKMLDDVLREFVSKAIRRGAGRDPHLTYETLLLDAHASVAGDLPANVAFETLKLIVSPTLSYSVDQSEEDMVCLTQQFEFSAAHRLHCPELSDEKNREVFGKCNNPEGHGHNYVVEVTLKNKVDDANGQVVALHDFEQRVKEKVIDRLDHKHLNRDIAEFENVNPTVENIAKQIWEWLSGSLGAVDLCNVRVYETPKTWADFAGE